MKHTARGATLTSVLTIVALLAAVGAGGYFGWKQYKANKIGQQLDQIQALASEWESALQLAASAPRIALAGPVQRMQDVRAKVRSGQFTHCAADVRFAFTTHMDPTIDGFLKFMMNEEIEASEKFDQGKAALAGFKSQVAACKNEVTTKTFSK